MNTLQNLSVNFELCEWKQRAEQDFYCIHTRIVYTLSILKKHVLDNELSVDTIKFYDNVTASSFKMDLTKLSMANKTVKLLD